MNLKINYSRTKSIHIEIDPQATISELMHAVYEHDEVKDKVAFSDYKNSTLLLFSDQWLEEKRSVRDPISNAPVEADLHLKDYSIPPNGIIDLTSLRFEENAHPKAEHIPNEFFCKLSGCVFKQPMISKEKILGSESVEKQSIEHCLRNSNKWPFNNSYFDASYLIVNQPLKDKLMRFKNKYPILKEIIKKSQYVDQDIVSSSRPGGPVDPDANDLFAMIRAAMDDSSIESISSEMPEDLYSERSDSNDRVDWSDRGSAGIRSDSNRGSTAITNVGFNLWNIRARALDDDRRINQRSSTPSTLSNGSWNEDANRASRYHTSGGNNSQGANTYFRQSSTPNVRLRSSQRFIHTHSARQRDISEPSNTRQQSIVPSPTNLTNVVSNNLNNQTKRALEFFSAPRVAPSMNILRQRALRETEIALGVKESFIRQHWSPLETLHDWLDYEKFTLIYLVTGECSPEDPDSTTPLPRGLQLNPRQALYQMSHLGEYHLKALKHLYQFGLEGDHLRVWRGRGDSKRMLFNHFRALNFLMISHNLEPETAIQLIQGKSAHELRDETLQSIMQPYYLSRPLRMI